MAACSEAAKKWDLLFEIEKKLNRKTEQVVADGGCTNRSTIEQMAAGGIDYYGSIKPATPNSSRLGSARVCGAVLRVGGS